MTGRTHDLAAFSTLGYVVVNQPIAHISLATALVAVFANLIGGLTPDIDQPTADLWHKFPTGTLFSRLITPFLGGHRYISHSILGILLFGGGLHYLLQLASHVVLVDMNIVWWSFMIGFISHLVMDTFTREGVPWLFPIPLHFGIPPFKFMRVKTGSFFEKSVIFPALLIFNAYFYYAHYHVFLNFLHKIVK